jgi:hypothetical protein
MNTVALIVILSVLGVLFLIAVAKRIGEIAPAGWEDEHGFHYGEKKGR